MNKQEQNKNTGHGHVRPRPDGMKARCGGPGLCRECAKELGEAKATARELESRVGRLLSRYGLKAETFFAALVYPSDVAIEQLEDELNHASSAATRALDDITRILGAPRWEYPGQVVRDVAKALGVDAAAALGRAESAGGQGSDTEQVGDAACWPDCTARRMFEDFDRELEAIAFRCVSAPARDPFLSHAAKIGSGDLARDSVLASVFARAIDRAMALQRSQAPGVSTDAAAKAIAARLRHAGSELHQEYMGCGYDGALIKHTEAWADAIESGNWPGKMTANGGCFHLADSNEPGDNLEPDPCEKCGLYYVND